MRKVLLIVGAGLLMVGCSEAPTAPAARRAAPPARPSLDVITCRSGYVIAYDENGNPYCAPAPDGLAGNGQTVTAGPNTAGPLPLPPNP